MTTLTVTHKKQTVAEIIRQNASHDGYTPAEPWVLKYTAGRIERFRNLNAAKYEANKTWPDCKFIK
jgi:hypothetical protein